VGSIRVAVKKKYWLPKLTLALVCCFAFAGIAATAPGQDADLILRNAHIVTMDLAHPAAQAMAVRDRRILAVGSDEQLAGFATKRTIIIDLHGQTVLPGLIDVHTHAMQWAKGIVRKQLDVTYPNVHSIADLVAMVAERASHTPKANWILGAGWDDAKFTEHRFVTRHDLDAVSPHNPVYLEHVSGHLAVANSTALALADVTGNTPSPTGGEIERDSSGEPTGVVKDTAMQLVSNFLPPDPQDINVQAARLISERVSALGLTSIHDIFLSDDEMRGYQSKCRPGSAASKTLRNWRKWGFTPALATTT
jgi:predicted amidohydrolase YtcJ